MRHKNIYEAFGMLRDLSKKIKSQQQDLMSKDDPRALRQMLQLALKRGTKGDIQEKVDIHADIALSIQEKLSEELAEAYNVVCSSTTCERAVSSRHYKFCRNKF
eukprot:gb/GECG01011161.1/.p1 GENE.gb/GECG01011161.1/~~gb/GECG01011161.1/.p1  ORF type:complete len:104 (+),score=17.53 gb/GECG01011161.1/:1-312(+)